ncbi:hypothetical protein PVE90_18250 [Pseudomonas carnis]|nr:hypothetical protein [Pseudomonas carnis]
MGMTSTGKLSAGVLEFLAICDQCQRPRNTGNHTKCSKARQQIHAARNQQSDSARSMQRGEQ